MKNEFMLQEIHTCFSIFYFMLVLKKIILTWVSLMVKKVCCIFYFLSSNIEINI